VSICIFAGQCSPVGYRQNTEFGKRSLKYKTAKFYNNLPEEIRFDLGDSVRYNKSVLRNYLLNTEQ